MNTATMDGSRALYALSEEKMTIKQLGVLNRHHVPARAMTVDMLLNIFLVLYFGNIFFILAAGNVGLHVLARARALGCPAPAQGPSELAEADQARRSRGWWRQASSASPTCSSSSSASLHGLHRLPLERGLHRCLGQAARDDRRRRRLARWPASSATWSPSTSTGGRSAGVSRATSSPRRRPSRRRRLPQRRGSLGERAHGRRGAAK